MGVRHGLGSRLWHHLPIGAGSAALTVGLYSALSYSREVQGWSLATAYVGLALAALGLALGPIRVLRGRRIPLSIDLRRDIGIWAGIVGSAHVAFGLQVHLGGHPLQYFLDTTEGTALRISRFGFGNYSGLVATLLLVLLLALSSDRAMGALGGRRWKRLHRLNYGLFALVVVHALLYQSVEGRASGVVAMLLLLVAGVVAVQAAGYRRRRTS